MLQISGDLSLPDLTPQQWLFRFFSGIHVADWQVNDAGTALVFSGETNDIPDLPDTDVILRYAEDDTATAALGRNIELISAVSNTGERLDIALAKPTQPATLWMESTDRDLDPTPQNYPAFYSLLMPDTDPVSFLDYTGSPGNDLAHGFETDDVLRGAAGNDTILGLAGIDELSGGAGDDLLTGGAGEDILQGGEGADVFSGTASDMNGDRILDFGAGDTLLFEGIAFQRDAVAVTLGSAVLDIDTDGNGTADTTITLDGDFSGVSFAVASDDDGTRITLIIPPVDLTGTDGADELDGNAGDDRLIGLGGNDTLRGNDGSDTLNGGDGDDVILGGATSIDRRDVIYAGAGDDSVDGGYGNDQIFGQGGNDTIAGGFGADELQGQDGDDVITGSAFGDTIFGNAGDDFLNGGFGHDLINGGTGADRFFHVGIEGHGSDWVQDYNAAEGDVLVFGGSGNAGQFQVNTTHTADKDTGERSGDNDVEEAFVIYKPTGQIMWALVDGGGQTAINLQIGGEVFDLLG